jgi:hypothetical protein
MGKRQEENYRSSRYSPEDVRYDETAKRYYYAVNYDTNNDHDNPRRSVMEEHTTRGDANHGHDNHYRSAGKNPEDAELLVDLDGGDEGPAAALDDLAKRLELTLANMAALGDDYYDWVGVRKHTAKRLARKIREDGATLRYVSTKRAGAELQRRAKARRWAGIEEIDAVARELAEKPKERS